MDPGFNWVVARDKCSARNVFEELRLAAQENVKVRNTQVNGKPLVAFSAQANAFSIWNGDKTGPEHGRVAADFSLDGERIIVKSLEKEWTITLTLDDEGICKCRVGDKALDVWQVLRMALEPVLFAV